MGTSDGRVLIIIVIASIAFFVGRRFQRTRDKWAGWGSAIKDAKAAADKVPKAKADAWAAVRGMLAVGVVVLIFFAVVVNALRYG
ncbi:hypothetical protein [Planomonospora parontospora]|uniref:hypothetical protein n=1 Tax=Planomonospora parontospora TaxID=58119 RepID=UPI0016706E77|nr:hypothetical protein [Planomonospora parontospora]GGL02876.1 hypothetical protein GCM10014719_01310 [Planomonospora parontospora subsp. antibiotica]GII13291.1 hypothetical protein Ppa05_00170 [Planomonospora parontospora subsp. antibiotica]